MRVGRRSGRWARQVGLVGVAAAMTCGLAGCGGGATAPHVASADGAAPAANASKAAGDELTEYINGVRSWVKCLRDEGIGLSDPDPHGNVTFDDPHKVKSDPNMLKSQTKCSHLHPAVPESLEKALAPKLSPQQIKTERRYATCMQQNGAPDFPDPDADGYISSSANWQQDTPEALRASNKCAPIIGAQPFDPSTSTGLG